MKRFLICLLALVMVFGCFSLAACKDGGDETTSSTTTESPALPVDPEDSGADTTVDDPSDTTVDDPSDTTTDVPTPPVDPNATYIDIVSGGKTEYVIRYAFDNETLYKGVAEELAEAIRAKTGAEVAVKSDFIVGNSKPGAYEILIGATNREDSIEASKELNVSQFVVKVSGSRVVLSGGSPIAACSAVGYFAENIVNKAENNALSLKSDYSYVSDGSGVMELAGASIANYTIVIPEKFTGSDYRVAVYLKGHLYKLYQINLEIQTDAKTYSNEILIGATKRTTAAAPKTSHGYSVEIKDGKVQLQAASIYAYDALNSYMTDDFFNPTLINVNYDNGFKYEKDITSTLADGQEYTTKRDGDMRIMFFNMWGNSTTNYGPRDQHQMLAAEIVNGYAPDIIGFQEFNNHNRDDGWWSMDTLLEAYGYREVVEFEYVRKWLDDKGGKHETQVISDGTRPTNNFTPIFYNPEKVELVKADFVPYGERNEEGYHLVDKSRGYNGYYMMHNDYFSKSLTWAVFKDKATGKLFGVLSTHFWYEGSADGNLARVENARVVNATVTSMLEQYPDIPIFVGGDFNCNPSSDPYKELLNGGLVDVQGIATRTENHKTYHSKQEYDKMFVPGNKNVGIDINKNKEESDSKWIVDGYLGTWVKWYHPGGSYKDSIDHIFIYGDTASKLDIKMFDIVASKMALIASDHCPLICDFNLK